MRSRRRLGAQMNVLRIGFFTSLAVWLGGALITYEYGTEVKRLEMMLGGTTSQDLMMMNLRGISINLFGPLAIVLGLVLAGVWLFRRVSPSATEPGPVLAAAPVSPPAAQAPPQAIKPTLLENSHDGPLSCDFSGWIRDGERIVQEYAFEGQGLSHKLAVEITVEKGAISLLRFVNFWLIPSNGYDGEAEVRLVDKNTGKSPEEVAKARAEANPAGRFGTIEEFGDACAFLCSAQAGYITGQNLLLDGGAYPGTFG